MRTVSSFVFIIIFLVSCHPANRRASPAAQVHSYLQERIDSLTYFVHQMQKHVAEDHYDSLQAYFTCARGEYKKVEGLAEFYFPGVCKVINGPAIYKMEEYDDNLLPPAGFQVIEDYLFPAVDTTAGIALQREAGILASSLIRLQQLVATTEFTDANIFEAERLQLLRIMSLGISGFDSPVALQSIPEAAAALEGMKDILACYATAADRAHSPLLFERMGETIAFLQRNADFNSFDRARFIVQHMNALSSAVYAWQQALEIPNNPYITAVDMSQPTFFAPGVFDVRHFSPGYNRQHSQEMIALGRVLFFDPILSGNNSRSCASCHQPSRAFTDGRARSIAFDLKGEVPRNAPSLINAGFQKSLFWDQRIQFLEDQITDVMTNPNEMHGHIKQAATRLAQSDAYRVLFGRAFGGASKEAVSDRHIQVALAWYIRSLESLDAPFDQYMRGDTTQLTADQRAGFNLFMGKGKCATCHFLPLFNGTVPPLYQESEAEVLGVPQAMDTVGATLDTDSGKWHAHHRAVHQYAFKTPTVRNAALTAPYMHNGVYATLHDVLDFYNRGGGAGIGIKLENQTLPPDPLQLTAHEQQQIVDFIHALTDTTALMKQPTQLPAFENQAFNNRKLGGTY